MEWLDATEHWSLVELRSPCGFAVRLRSPSDFEPESFRRRVVKHASPKIEAVTGVRNGAARDSLQSLHFAAAEGWTTESVEAWVRGASAQIRKAAEHPNPLRRAHRCKYGQEPATKALVWAEGRAFIPVCDEHEALARRVIHGNHDEVDRVVALPTEKADDGAADPTAVAPDDTPSLLDRERAVRVVKAAQPTEERFVYGVVLEPEVEDTQGDIYSAEEVRKAAHWYMEHGRGHGLMHRASIADKVTLLESYVAPADFTIEGQAVRKGTWVMAWRIIDDTLWGEVKAGRLTGFSIGGDSIKVPERSAA